MESSLFNEMRELFPFCVQCSIKVIVYVEYAHKGMGYCAIDVIIAQKINLFFGNNET